MRIRHELWMKKYPNVVEKHGIPWTGLENAAPEIQELSRPSIDISKLPFDPLEYIDHLDELPFDPDMDPNFGE
jgi:arylsulfatase